MRFGISMLFPFDGLCVRSIERHFLESSDVVLDATGLSLRTYIVRSRLGHRTVAYAEGFAWRIDEGGAVGCHFAGDTGDCFAPREGSRLSWKSCGLAEKGSGLYGKRCGLSGKRCGLSRNSCELIEESCELAAAAEMCLCSGL